MKHGRSKVTAGTALGVMAGAVGAFTYNPGTITPEEIQTLAQSWGQVLQSKQLVANAAGGFEWSVNEGEIEMAREAWDVIGTRWEDLEEVMNACLIYA